jgi:hypothetical protein
VKKEAELMAKLRQYLKFGFGSRTSVTVFHASIISYNDMFYLECRAVRLTGRI